MSEAIVYRKRQRQYHLILTLGIILNVFIILISLCYGNYKTSPLNVYFALTAPEEHPQVYSIITLSRVPRLISSIFVGASLSISGLVYQDLFSNRMASPDVLGVSAGAGVGASVSIFYGAPFALTSICAFVGGILAVVMTLLTSKLFGHRDRESVTLILAGIVVGGLMNSILGLFKYLSNDAQLSSITFWLLGGFYNATYRQIVIACPVILLGTLILFMLRWKIVMLRNGDADATSHGINAKAVRYTCISITTIITSMSICISGTIGWIGLAIPNLMRLLVNNDGKRLMPLSLVYGSLFSSLCDLMARSITNTEIPVGIISGVLGAVIFILVLLLQISKG